MNASSREPEDANAAPKCERCGYSLYGLPELKCPECGWMSTYNTGLAYIRARAEHDAGRDTERRSNFIVGVLGIGMFVIGAILMVSGLAARGGVGPWGPRGSAIYSLPFIVVAGYTYFRYATDESWRIIWLGGSGLCLAIGFCVWFVA